MAGVKITDLNTITVTSQSGYLVASNDGESGKIAIPTFLDLITPELDERYSDWTNQITISTAAQGASAALTPNTHETFILSSVTSPSLTSFFISLPKASNSFLGQSKTIISTKDVQTIVITVDSNNGYSANAALIGNTLGYLVAYQPVCFLCVRLQDSTQSVTWMRVA